MAYRRNPGRLPATARPVEEMAGYDADGNRVRVQAYEARGAYWMIYQRDAGGRWITAAEQQFTGATARARFDREMTVSRVLLAESAKQHDRND